MNDTRGREIEELLVDSDCSLAEAVARGLISEEEAAEWKLWDFATRHPKE